MQWHTQTVTAMNTTQGQLQIGIRHQETISSSYLSRTHASNI